MAATSYARLLATSKRTVLVDLDFREATLTRALTPRASIGLWEHEVLGKGAGPEVWRDARTGLDFIPARATATAKTQGGIESEQLLQIVANLMAKYDRVIVDLPPLAVAIEAGALQSLIGGYLFVAHWGVTRRKDVSRALAESRLQEGKVAGAVLTNVDLRRLRQYEFSG